MPTLADVMAFDRDLRARAGSAVWPFLCDGLPFECDVFLVGINPASEVPLWPYWSIERGCDKAAWLKAYLEKRGRLRPTRARIERLCRALAPARALETNIYHHHSLREADLAKERRTTEVFDFLLARLKPRVVFAHGRSAVAHLETLTGTVIERDMWTPVRYRGVAFDVLAGRHLAYGWSYAAVDRLGRNLRERCGLGEAGRRLRGWHATGGPEPRPKTARPPTAGRPR